MGAVVGLLWANSSFLPISHQGFLDLLHIENDFIGHWHGEGSEAQRVITVTFIVNEMLMPLFFFIAGKEVFEAVVLPGGQLRGRQAILPITGAVGGMAGPALVYLGIAYLYGNAVFSEIGSGWAIPTATDIAFSFLVARLILGTKHPATLFLLTLAIVDDALGVLILALFYPSGAMEPSWLLLSFAAALFVYLVFNFYPAQLDKVEKGNHHRLLFRQRFKAWPYIIAGVLSWYGFYRSGIHPALGLLPIVLTIPHAARDEGLFIAAEKHKKDLLNTMEHALKPWVEGVLFFFALVNCGVAVGAFAPVTWAVVVALLVGKPIGIFLAVQGTAHALRIPMSASLGARELLVLGIIAGIGFTVSIFVSTVAFPGGGALQEAAKMGALLSFASALIAYAVARLLAVKRIGD